MRQILPAHSILRSAQIKTQGRKSKPLLGRIGKKHNKEMKCTRCDTVNKLRKDRKTDQNRIQWGERLLIYVNNGNGD